MKILPRLKLFLTFFPVVGAAFFATTALCADVPAADQPGLTLTIEPLTGNALSPDKRVSRMMALDVEPNSAPSVFVPAGPFRATFEGDINMRLRDFLLFSAEGSGKLKLSLDGKPVLDLTGSFAGKVSESTRLGKGKNHVVAVYESVQGQPAELRLFWATSTTLREPIPPTVFTHGPDDALAKSLQIREGRELVGQLRCTKCHAVSDLVTPTDALAMPELAMDAPSFEGIGSRLNTDWLAAWISNPKSLRAKAHMPRRFTAREGIAPEARDIAAYLLTLAAKTPPAAAPTAKAEAGGRLFANLNCVACHISPERSADAAEGDAGRISFAYVKAKFKPGALKQFLLNPSAHYAWISMPNFRLSDAEADELSAYLLSIAGKPLPAAGAGDAANGAKLVASAGCLNCHSLGANQNAAPKLPAFATFSAIGKPAWSSGCMATDPAARKSAPDFALTEPQRAAIAAFAATGAASLKQDSAVEFTERQITTLRCTACHARDGHESLLATELDAESQELHTKFPTAQQGEGAFSPDQRAPMLTWAGEKLRPEWMQKFIAGEIPYKPRYYLRARMPGFGVRATLLAQGLAEEHGCRPTYPEYAPADKKLAEAGQGLTGKAPNASFACIQCHSVNQQAAIAPFEAPAINFMYVTSRIREDYYYRWIHDPLRIDPETKMPRFDDADGKTGVPVFDNDAHKQFEAIWNYLLTGKDIAPPAQ